MFQLAIPTEAKLVDARILSQKNRKPDEDSGVKITFRMKLANDALAGFDPALKQFMWAARAQTIARVKLKLLKKGDKGDKGDKGAQQGLDGVEPISDMAHLSNVGAHIKTLKWTQEMAGYTLTVDQGLGGKRSNLMLTDCMLLNWRMGPEEGGSVELAFDCESEHVSKAAWAVIPSLKSRKVIITLLAPVISDTQANIDGAAPGKFFEGSDNPFGSTDAAEAALVGRKPKPAKAGAEVTPTDAFLLSKPGDEVRITS